MPSLPAHQHDAAEKAMGPRENPRHPMFRDHNCSYCASGEKPCRATQTDANTRTRGTTDMASTQKHHHELTNGVGKCSVPMWQMGCPAGFCDAPAYGERPPCNRIWSHVHGRYIRTDFKYDGYVPGLACVAHGGPEAPPKPSAPFIDIVFDGPPSHDSGRFVEVEDESGKSISIGEWVKRDDGYWTLRVPSAPSMQAEIDRLRALNGDLRAALKEALDWVLEVRPETEQRAKMLRKIRALAKQE